jgi:hypothetical protein
VGVCVVQKVPDCHSAASANLGGGHGLGGTGGWMRIGRGVRAQLGGRVGGEWSPDCQVFSGS